MLINNNILQLLFHTWQKIFLILLLYLLVGCSVIDAQKGTSLSSTERWIILPFENFTLTPRAGEKVEAMLISLLRIKGITNLEMYQQPDEDKSTWPEFNDERKRQEIALLTNKDKATYAVTGSVEEWQYKHGVGNEPAVGLSIRIIEITTGKVIWSASGARSGWSTESLSGTAQKLLGKLISSLQIIKKPDYQEASASIE